MYSFDSFEQSVLEHIVSIQPEPYQFYAVSQPRLIHEELTEGKLYFAIEGRHALCAEKNKEILQFRFMPIVWAVDFLSAIYPAQIVWYANYKGTGWLNTFELCVDHEEKIVRFGPSGNLMIEHEELRGMGIGTYLWRILILWAKYEFPDYRVYKIMISAIDATEDNLERRNHFFQKHGFVPQFSDDSKKSGFYYCEKVSDLTESAAIPDWEPKNPVELAASLLADNEDANRTIRNILDKYQNLLKNHVKVSDQRDRFKVASFIMFAFIFCVAFYWIYRLFN